MYWLYIAGVALVACGFADFPLIAFHLSRTELRINSKGGDRMEVIS